MFGLKSIGDVLYVAGNFGFIGSAYSPGLGRLFTGPGCPGDFNCDSAVNADDLGDYITCYFSTPLPCNQADFNADGEINSDDLGDFITTYFGPAC